MLLKNSCIALTSAIGIFTVPSIAIAKDIESYEDYKMYCSSVAYQYGIQSPDCEKYKSIFEQRDIQENNVRQKRQNGSIRRRNVRTEKKSTSKKRGYIGINPGAFIPDSNELETGAGISLYGGTKFNPNFAADFEISLLGGNTIYTDVAYGVFAAFMNPRFILPFDRDNEKTASLYFSPGIGVSTIGVGDGNVTFTDETRATWQAKAGVSAPVSNKLDIFGQVRYASQFQENTVDFFGTEIGLNLNL